MDGDDLGGHGQPTAKRLMHFKHLPSITDSFHSSQSKNGFAYSISVMSFHSDNKIVGFGKLCGYWKLRWRNKSL